MKKIINFINILLNNILDFVYPPRCIFCTSIMAIDQKEGICEYCKSNLSYIKEPVCEICGRMLIEEHSKNSCKTCRKTPPSFEKGYALFQYEGFVKSVIYRFKYDEHPEYAKVLGKQMSEKVKNIIKEKNIDVIIPVPMYKPKLKKRGYNQSELLAKEISSQVNIPIDTISLQRIKYTTPQMKLSVEERYNNLKNAFEIVDKNRIKYKDILIIDDIYTTGSTVNNCAQILKNNSANKIYILSLSIGMDK